MTAKRSRTRATPRRSLSAKPAARRNHAVESKLNQPQSAGSAPKGQAGDDGTAGNIDKVRDILFGGQMREYERRFIKLEERLLKETAELRDDLRKRLASLEQYMKQESSSLSDRIKAEHDDRNDATKDLAKEAKETAKAFEKKTGQLDDHISKVQRELRQQLLELQQHMNDDLRQKIDEVLARIGQEANQLRVDKADRATLAELLTEMAMRLTNELSIPGLDNGKRG